jgi:hypothetical protein
MKYSDQFIYTFLNDKKYQTEYEETGEYEMHFRCDMPKILNEFVEYIVQQRLSAIKTSDYSQKIKPIKRSMKCQARIIKQ